MNKLERSILAITCFGHSISHFNMLVFPAVVLPLAKHLGVDMAFVLALSFWQYLFFGLTALPWGYLGDRFGPKPFMVVFFLGAGLSGLAAAFLIDYPIAFSIALGGVGLFSGAYHPIALGMISKGISKTALAMGYNGVFGNIGLATAPLVAGVTTYLWGVRAAYIALGLFNLAGLVMMLVMTMPDLSGPNGGRSSQADPPSVAPFFILLVAMMLGGLAYRGATVIIPTYFEVRSAGILEVISSLWPGTISGNLLATVLSSIIFLVGAVGQYLGGRVGERFEKRWAYFTFHALTIPAAVAIAYLTDLPLFLVAMAYLFLMVGMQPIENALVSRFTPARFQHSAYGAKFILTFGIGAAAVHMDGAIERAFSLGAVFIALALISLGLVMTVLVLINRSQPVR